MDQLLRQAQKIGGGAGVAARIARKVGCLAGAAGGGPFAKVRHDILMKANWSDKTFQLCYFSRYDQTFEIFLRGLNEPFILVDIGANQGIYSLIACSNERCLAAIAFEPVPDSYKMLQENIRINKLSERVRSIRVGISSKSGPSTIFTDPMHSGTASLEKNSNSQSGSETIDLITMAEADRIIPEGGDIVVKIDVEGHEEVVIEQLVASVHISRMTAVFYEVDERRVDPSKLQEALSAVGFRSFTMCGEGKHYDVLALRNEYHSNLNVLAS